jgi:hypothetical protein
MKYLAMVITLAFALTPTLFGRGHSSGHHSSSGRSYSHRSSSTRTYSSRSHGTYRRSRAARAAFERSHPCPATGRTSGACPGYVVDHVQPLACGGADAPSNMQWQTTADAKAKDQWERAGCAR